MTTDVHAFKLSNEELLKKNLRVYFDRVRLNVSNFFNSGFIYDSRTLTNKDGKDLLEVIFSLYYFNLFKGISGESTKDFQDSLNDPFLSIQSPLLTSFNNYSLSRIMNVLAGIKHTILTTINNAVLDSLIRRLDNGYIQQQDLNNIRSLSGFYVSDLIGFNNIIASAREDALADGSLLAKDVVSEALKSNLKDINTKKKERVSRELAFSTVIVLNQDVDMDDVEKEVNTDLDDKFNVIINRLAMTETQVAVETFREDEVEKTNTFAKAAGLLFLINKLWVSILDNRTRAWHLEADGQTQPLGEPFIVNGEELSRPGDTSLGASLNNIINCRCQSEYSLLQ